MEIKKYNNNIILENATDFNLDHIFDCGQCFRFKKTNQNEYTGVAFGKILKISQENDNFVFHNVGEDDFNSIWREYLDLNTDYGKIKKILSGEECMDNAIKEGYGIRILHQDLFEAMISFIISQSNNIPRIKSIIETLCREFGNEICLDGEAYYSFPSAEAILEGDISVLHAGYRDKYILYAADRVFKHPEFLDELRSSDTQTAKKMLMDMTGIGNKVSDCILLFGLGKTDSFPVDVWMRRIMENLYFKKKCTIKEISEYAENKFGKFSGIAQQYLFFYALNHKNELNGSSK